MNGLEFAPEEAVISWKGAFGSQGELKGFSDTTPLQIVRTCSQMIKYYTVIFENAMIYVFLIDFVKIDIHIG